jgi:hypothetical protein
VRINGRPLLHDTAASKLNAALSALTLTSFEVVDYRTTAEGGGAATAQYAAFDQSGTVHTGEVDFRLDSEGKFTDITFRDPTS